MDSERRAAKRMTFYSDAVVEGLDASRAPIRISDLSTTGAFLDARTVLPVGTTMRVRFVLLGTEIDVLSEVRYSLPGFGMGVRFLDLQPGDRQAIDALVQRVLEEPSDDS